MYEHKQYILDKYGDKFIKSISISDAGKLSDGSFVDRNGNPCKYREIVGKNVDISFTDGSGIYGYCLNVKLNNFLEFINIVEYNEKVEKIQKNK